MRNDRAIALSPAAAALLERPPSLGEASITWDPIPMAGAVGTFRTPGYGDRLEWGS